MNIIFRSVITLILSMLSCASMVHADSKFYIGAKGGSMSTSLTGLGSATNLGVLLGYKMNKTFALEGEFTTTTSDGSVNGFGNWSVDTYSVYAAGRWGDKAYLKGKIGILSEDISISGGFVSGGGSDTGLSLGIGAGYSISDKINIEVEYTLIEEDIDFISLGVNYYF